MGISARRMGGKVMDKSELERKLECAEFYTKSLEYKINTLEPKAEAYDRIMSGGKKTLKELANILGKPIAFSDEMILHVFSEVPVITGLGFWSYEKYLFKEGLAKYMCGERFFDILIDFTGSWQDSLTIPDGWEEK